MSLVFGRLCQALRGSEESQTAFSDRSGIPIGTVARAEIGAARWTVDHLVMFSRALGTDGTALYRQALGVVARLEADGHTVVLSGRRIVPTAAQRRLVDRAVVVYLASVPPTAGG